MSHFDCVVKGHTTRQVGDTEWRCNGCDCDEAEMERVEEGLLIERDWCRRNRWPEHHNDNCAFCAYVAAGGPLCRYDRMPLLDGQERAHGICRACWDEGTQETG